MEKNEVLSFVVRYLILLILPLGNLVLFYSIFTPATVFPVFLVIEKLYNGILLPGNVIFFKGYYAEIIPACVAGAAYYFLLILNLTTPMPIKKRLKSLTFLIGTFLFLNVARIIIFAMLIFVGYQYFDLTHSLTWYFGSTALIVLIWFANVRLFKIESIPIYTDFKSLFSDIFQRN